MTQSGQQTQRTSINSDNRELGSGSRLPTWWGPRVYGGGGGKRDPALFAEQTEHILSLVDRPLHLLTYRTVPLRLFPHD